MLNVEGVIKRIFPNGTNETHENDSSLEQCPFWPPDLFAVAASLVEISGCYVQSRFSDISDLKYLFDDTYHSNIDNTANEWREKLFPPSHVTALWSELLTYCKEEIQVITISSTGKIHATTSDWHFLALQLMAIADKTSTGIGLSVSDIETNFSKVIMIEHKRINGSRDQKMLDISPMLFKNLPYSLAFMVPKEVACVQPKIKLPQIGYTLRHLSHNLALLPSVPQVITRHHLYLEENSKVNPETTPLNILLIPFPYYINNNAFSEAKVTGNNKIDKIKYFTVNQIAWLADKKNDNEYISAEILYKNLISPLIKQSKIKVGELNGIVMPELALPVKIADKLADILKVLTKVKGDLSQLDFFITGISKNEETGHITSPTNAVAAYFFNKGKINSTWKQSKHHRWGLERNQILRYQLGHLLHQDSIYWEKIDVSDRHCNFIEFRPGITLTTLICEDLARQEPFHQVIRGVGPNLVIALLMDGPQLQTRWSARHATVLAEDPGSSVLTLTCLGMIRRSTPLGEPENRTIALWKQVNSNTQELVLPPNDHALVLSLSPSFREEFQQFTLDQRSADRISGNFELYGVHSVKLNDKEIQAAIKEGIQL